MYTYKRTVLFSLAYLLLIVFLFIGSAQAAKFSAQKFVPSGFMKNYPEFKPSPAGEGGMSWRDQSVDYKRFDKIAIFPIIVWYHPDAKYLGIKPKKLAAITTRLENRLSQTFAKKFKVVNKPGPNVLVIRAAITNVVIKKPGIFKKITPIGWIATGVQKAGNRDVKILNSALELEIYDGASKKRIAAGYVFRPGKKKSKKKKKYKSNWKRIEASLEYWASRINARVNALQQSGG